MYHNQIDARGDKSAEDVVFKAFGVEREMSYMRFVSVFIKNDYLPK